MNQLCKVCGEPAAGFHFGAFTCEGCKSFFGRTYNNIAAIASCKHNGDCVINKKNRTACKACRLRKCLIVGMSKSGSRYGRRSNWFKIHCLLQEQQSSSVSNDVVSSNNKKLDQLGCLQYAGSHARQTYQDKINPCINSATAILPTIALQSANGAQRISNDNAASSVTTIKTTSRIPSALQKTKYHRQLKTEPQSRLSNTPSDSGASSSGDPTDDITSILSSVSSKANLRKSPNQDNFNPLSCMLNPNTNAENMQQHREKELLQLLRTHSNPIYSPFVPYSLPPSLLTCAPFLPVVTIASVIKEQFKSELLFPTATVEDEPMDLSLRSCSDHVDSALPAPSRSEIKLSPTISPSVNSYEDTSTITGKTAPLDLTVVRSQASMSLSGL